MLTKRLLTAFVLVTCAAIVCSGCLRTGQKKPQKDEVDIGVGPIKDDVTTAGGGRLGSREVFEKGKRLENKYETVLFDYDSAQVADSERSKIEAVAQLMKNDPATVVILEGHCDERGSTEYNISLGERRALAVRAYLTSLGVDAERMQPRSFGEEKPVNMGHDEESWSINRRVEFVVMRAD